MVLAGMAAMLRNVVVLKKSCTGSYLYVVLYIFYVCSSVSICKYVYVCSSVSIMQLVLRLAALRAAGAPLLQLSVHCFLFKRQL